MNTFYNQDKQLSRNLWILLGVCLLTAIITIVGGYYSTDTLIISNDQYMQVFFDRMNGGIISFFKFWAFDIYQFVFGFLLIVISITESIISLGLLTIALLFQIGYLQDWKIIISNIMVGLMNFIKALFIVYLLYMIELTYKVSYLLAAIFSLQIIVSLLPIVLSAKFIYIPSYKKLHIN